jgi:hypothetical protein
MIEMLADLIPLLGLVLFGDPKHADPFYRDHLVPALDELGERWADALARITGRNDRTSRNSVLAQFGVVLMFALDQRRSANPPDIETLAEELAREGYAPIAQAEPKAKARGIRRR